MDPFDLYLVIVNLSHGDLSSPWVAGALVALVALAMLWRFFEVIAEMDWIWIISILVGLAIAGYAAWVLLPVLARLLEYLVIGGVVVCVAAGLVWVGFQIHDELRSRKRLAESIARNQPPVSLNKDT